MVTVTGKRPIAANLSLSLSLLSLKAKAQRHLRYSDCKYWHVRDKHRNACLYKLLNIFNQNIGGLGSKSDESIYYLEILNITAHIVCLSVCHIEGQDLLHLTLLVYIIGSSYIC